MASEIWRFLASPNKAVDEERVKNKKGKKASKQAPPNTRLPWVVSAAVFADLARVLFGTVVLLALAYEGDQMPNWFIALIFIHCAAMIATLVFVLNGFSIARLVLIVLAVGQLWFDQTILTRYFLLCDAVIVILFFIGPAARYFAACEQVRQSDRDARWKRANKAPKKAKKGRGKKSKAARSL